METEIKAIENSSLPWERLVWVFTGLVVVGVLMECWVIRHEYSDDVEAWELANFVGVIRSPSKPSIMKLAVEVISVSLVAIRVAGELESGIEIQHINSLLRGKSAELRSKSDDLRSKSEQLVALVTRQAGDAATSAENARKEADTATEEAAALGPRAKLLVRAAPELMAELSFFAGQRVGLFVCGKQGTPDQETLDTWAAIANILGSDFVSGMTGAKWKEVPTNLNFADGCGAARGLGQGVMVFVSKRASRQTMEAANALGRGLAKALPPSPNKMPSLIDPYFAKLTADRGLQDRHEPWVSVGLDPDLITVVIGAHP
ncbi:MAG: hypothetical protein WCA33_02870 [Candidatus Acidiferrales bacterium]